jgi:hypothetical protein
MTNTTEKLNYSAGVLDRAEGAMTSAKGKVSDLFNPESGNVAEDPSFIEPHEQEPGFDFEFGSIYDLFDTPKEVIDIIGDFAGSIDQPVEAGLALKMGEKILGCLPPEMAADLAEVFKPHLFDDAQLDRGELIKAISDYGHKISDVEPDAKIVKQAQAKLEELGIADDDGSLARGIAKVGVKVAVQAQYKKGDLNLDQAIPSWKEPSDIGPDAPEKISPDDVLKDLEKIEPELGKEPQIKDVPEQTPVFPKFPPF